MNDPRATPTWADAVFESSHAPGRYNLRCRRAVLGERQPDNRIKELVYPVSNDGKNLTRSPVAIESFFELNYPFSTYFGGLGRKAEVIVFPHNTWRPWIHHESEGGQ